MEKIFEQKVQEDIESGVIEIPKHSAMFSNANVLRVTVGTNTPMGGDSGHGGRTVFEIEDKGATSWTVKVTKDGKQTAIVMPEKIEIILGGDTEAETFIQCLKFAYEILRMQNKETKAFDISTVK